MRSCLPYQVDPLADEARRLGFNAILEQLREENPGMKEDELRAFAKQRWYERNT